MPLVFIHGVNVREGEEYEQDMELRNRLFADVFYKILGRNVPDSAILSPYWGELAPTGSTDNPYLPKLGLKGLQERRRRIRALLPEATKKILGLSSNPLLALAKSGSMEEMFDLMVTVAHDDVKNAADGGKRMKSLSRFAYETTKWRQKFKGRKQQLEWLNDIGSDEELLDRLQKEIKLSPAELNLRTSVNMHEWIKNRLALSKERIKDRLEISRVRLKDGVEASRERIKGRLEQLRSLREDSRQRIRARLELSRSRISKARKIARGGAKAAVASTRKLTTNVAALAISNPARKIFHAQMSAFIGDSFFYFGSRGERFDPGPVPAICIQAIEDAASMRTQEDPDLIVVAHSMGSNIICDILSYFAPNLEIDLVLTVGAQFPLFADLDMFPGFSADERPIPKPEAALNWINFYDPNDFLGYAAGGVFDGIIDVHFSSGRFGVTTHADYFKFVSFFELMGRTVCDVLDIEADY
ncbi:MAG: apolipoprotein A1/A4/E family protein [Candidatus Obscuribacterales bacterium]|nr:apolipoprotein A1/A4/E family protein [Candidatus Obscuribacterales bacterium]